MAAHMDQHHMRTGLAVHVYSPMDAQAQVCLLQNGIRITSLNLVKTTILVSATLRNDFAAETRLCADFIKQMDATNTIKIASLDQHGGDGGRDSGG